MYRRILKPSIDLLVGWSGLILSLPLLIPLSVILAIDFKGNPFFVQDRIGKGGKIFKIFKLRTMKDIVQSNGDLLPDKERLTLLGRWLRKASLDELPQFLNVALGDMSLIGPRPLLVDYLPLYSKEESKRHAVKPGITGLAQVNGRNTISWKEKFAYDLEYVNRISFKLDVRILVKSVRKPFDVKDVYTEEEYVAPFRGHE
ncbi:sugar transferase [Echinicola vietnamensis]|uniref:Glycosyl transferase possibly involved in lipopolysaccharide synthesis n=1 Tax=Echinicola vietnamensis (strain DSM 17526 / LMG 23754 / KMM 6221) TaxID=926556 RepID=L0FTJ1_ECHVK|nr:sugar transferase [Echinicola vietnamensis]AGA76363.1 glycosyl transferase possibly involved in lipopolysaccharide synthesis [Echinicola vietnamensis DSM 17526]